MDLIRNVLENLSIMVLSVVALIACGWLLLLMLEVLIRLKAGTRERDGLTRLWETALTKKDKPSDQDENETAGKG